MQQSEAMQRDSGFATDGASALQPGALTSYHLGPSARVWVRPPLPALAPFVDLLVYTENRVSAGTVSTFDLFPGPCPWLVFQLDSPLVSTGKAWNGRRVVLPRAGASGFFDFPMTSTGYGPTTDISVRIKPEAASLLLGTGNDELRNTHLDLADLWGREGDVALDRASSASSREDAVAAIELALLGRVARLSAELSLFAGRTIDVPAAFISGKADWGVFQRAGSYEAMQRTACTRFVETRLVDGAGHWVQQEQPAAVVEGVLRLVRGSRG